MSCNKVIKYLIILVFITIILLVIYIETIHYNINDPFFDRMSQYDLIAYSVKSKEEFKNKYIKNISKFENEDLEKLNNNNNIANIMIDKYIKSNNNSMSMLLSNLKNIKIEILKQPFIKYPHTLRQTIFTPFVIDPKTIIHEKIHILQRLYPIEFDNMYKMDNIIKTNYIYKLKRNNPDNNEFIYSINNNIIVCLYNSENPKNIDDVHYMIDDHPNEMYAYKYADLISM